MKPEDITQEVWRAAEHAFYDSAPNAVGAVEAIARAIMAAEKRGAEREREACARMADEEERKRLSNMRSAQEGSAEWGNPQEAALAQGHKAVTAMSIAAAIRNRGKP